uniref:Globin family profile domain-containing protein n=1 Tax=Panagrolaimus sp. PS1159 TaxID=55785 RepID=A0AC35F373_9BILA
MIHILQSMMNKPSTLSHRHSRKGRKRSSSASIQNALGVARSVASRSITLERLDLRCATPPGRRRILSCFSGRELCLDEDQVDALHTDFCKIKDKYAFFEAIFLQLFLKEDPEVAILFGLANVPEKDLKRRNAFRTHICKFLRFWTTIIDLLPKKGREDELIQIIRMVGRQHTHVKTLSFTAVRWLSFKTVLFNAFSHPENEHLTHAWNILICFLIYEIKDAYLSHIRHVRSNSVPHILEGYRLDFRKGSKSRESFEDDSIAE